MEPITELKSTKIRNQLFYGNFFQHSKPIHIGIKVAKKLPA